MIICQVFIFLFGASAVWLVGRTEHWRRWGYISGLCGGPFWLYVTAVNHQWGIFALSLFYSYSWAQGVYNYWIKPWRAKKKEAAAIGISSRGIGSVDENGIVTLKEFQGLDYQASPGLSHIDPDGKMHYGTKKP